MKVAATRALLLALSFTLSAGAARAFDVDTTDQDVDVLVEGTAESRQQPDLYLIYTYEAHNRRNEPITFTIQLSDCVNCRAGLIRSAVRLEPGQTVIVGSVGSDDATKKWSFKYQWHWESAGQNPAQAGSGAEHDYRREIVR